MEQISSEMAELLDQMYDSDDPVFLTGELATAVDRSRRDVERDLKKLALLDEVETKNPTGRARVWWIPGTRKPPRDDERGRALADGQAALDDDALNGADVGTDGYRDALDGWNPGRDADEREHKRTVGARVLEWLADREMAAQKSDVLADRDVIAPDVDVADATLWTEYARPALTTAAENEAVEKPKRGSYRWVGGGE